MTVATVSLLRREDLEFAMGSDRDKRRLRRSASIAALAAVTLVAPAVANSQQSSPVSEGIARLTEQQQLIDLIERVFREAEEARLRGDCSTWRKLFHLQFPKFRSISLIPEQLVQQWTQRLRAAESMPCPPVEDKQSAGDETQSQEADADDLSETSATTVRKPLGDLADLNQPVELQRVLDQFAAAEEGNLQAAKRCDINAMARFQKYMMNLQAEASDISILSHYFAMYPDDDVNRRLSTSRAKAVEQDLEERMVKSWQVGCAKPTTTLVLAPPIDSRQLDIKPVNQRSKMPLAVIGGAGAAAVGVLAAGGGETTPLPNTATTSPDPQPQQTQPPPPMPPPVVTLGPESLNGEYPGDLTATQNGCGFANSAPFRASVNFNSAGIGTIQILYLLGNQLYVFNNVSVQMNGSQGSFQAETISTQFGYRVIIQGTISGNTLTGNFSFFDPSRGNCHTGYSMRGTK